MTLSHVGEPCRNGGSPGAQFSFRLTAPNALQETLLNTPALRGVRIDGEHIRVEYMPTAIPTLEAFPKSCG